MADIDIAEVRRIAELARIELTEAEVARMAVELGRIVDYVGQLADIDAPRGDPYEAYAHVPSLPLRADEPAPCLDRDKVLAQAPAAADGAFAVPAFVDE